MKAGTQYCLPLPVFEATTAEGMVALYEDREDQQTTYYRLSMHHSAGHLESIFSCKTASEAIQVAKDAAI